MTWSRSPARAASTAVVRGALVLGSTGCSLPVDDNARPLGPDKIPAEIMATTTIQSVGTSSTTVSTVEPTATAPSNVYRAWFIDGEKLTPVALHLVLSVTALEMVNQLLAGPSKKLDDEGTLRSAIPARAVISASARAGVALVDLDPTFSVIPAPDQILALGQLVLSLTELPGVGQVRFTIAGEPAQVPRADGSQSDGPVTREDLLPLVGR